MLAFFVISIYLCPRVLREGLPFLSPMACPHASLTWLPVEVLHAIFYQLPSSAALAFIRTCRRIHAACDDPNVWRNLVALRPTLDDAYHHTNLRHRTEKNG